MSCLLSRPLTLRLIVTSALLGVCFLIAPHAHTIAPPAGQLQFSVSTYTAREGANVAITVTRTGDADRTFSVNYATQDNGTARAGADYVATNGTLTFLPGQTEQTFIVTTLNDEENDDEESIRLMLDRPTGGATLGVPAVASLIITREAHPLVVLNAFEYNVTEGGGETSSATIAVKLSEPSSQPITLDYGTYIGGITRYPDATPERDFIPTFGTLTFAPGQTRQTITIPLIDDSLVEDPESFGVNLRNATNTSLRLGDFFYVNIIDDDAPAGQLQFESATYSNLENAPQSLVVRRIGGKTGDVTVQYAVTGGTATAGVDYVFNYADPSTPTPTTGTLTIPNGIDKAFLTVNLLRDGLAEPDETIEFTLSNPTNGATLGAQTTAVLTITTDERPFVSIMPSPREQIITEGTGGTTAVTFTVSLSGPSDQIVTVDYGTEGSPNNVGLAKPGRDYIDISGTLTFAPGETTRTLVVSIIGDDVDEEREGFVVKIFNPVNAIVTDFFSPVTIIDDDAAPIASVKIDELAVMEGSADLTKPVGITVTLSAPSERYFRVGMFTEKITATPGTDRRTPGADYIEMRETGINSLYIFPGQTSGRLRPLEIIGDNTDEPDETFKVTVTGCFGVGNNECAADFSSVEQIVTIIDDDEPNSPGRIQFDISEYSIPEVERSAYLTVAWTGNTVAGASVRYATTGGTATAGTDYTPVSGTLTFAPGVFTRTIRIPITKPRGLPSEPDKTIEVTLSDPTGGADLGTPAVAVVRITDSGPAPGDILISEFRLRGARGARDEFIELYNNTDVEITLRSPLSITTDSPGNGESGIRIPAGTRIPARGHYLITNDFGESGYSLNSLARGDFSVSDAFKDVFDDDRGIAVFNTGYSSPPSNRLDAVGFEGVSGLYREGTPLRAVGEVDGEYSFVRRIINGRPQDTNDNAADFVLVSTTGGMFGSIQSVLGAPGAENLSSPVANVPPVVRVEPIDHRVPVNAAPNLIRDATPIVNGSHGTLIMHRTLTNDGDEPLTRLRFRIINLPTLGTSIPGRAQADLRALSSSDARVTLSDGSVVPIVGLTLEDPSQPLGGGLNSTLAVGTITIASPLKAGARVNVGLRFGIERSGRYRLGLLLERDSQTGGRRSMRGRSRNSSSAQEDVIR